MNKVLINQEADNLFFIQIKQKGETINLKLQGKGRNYEVLEFEVVDRSELTVAFSSSPNVEILDTTSDSAQCFGIVHKVRIGSVVLGTTSMRANSVEELGQSLSQVKLATYNWEEI